MGTYSQPSRVLDTSFSNVGKDISDAAALAIKNMNAANKKAILEKQKLEKEKKKAELEEKKRQAKIGGEETKDIAKIKGVLGQQENLQLIPKVNQGYTTWGANDGIINKTATDKYNKYIKFYEDNKADIDAGKYDINSPNYDDNFENELDDQIFNAGLDPNAFSNIVSQGGLPTSLGGDEVLDEVGVSMEDQLVNGVKHLYAGLRDINPYSDDYEKQKQLINTFSQEGINMVALINQTTQMINPYESNSPFDEKGNLLGPERGIAGRYLFSDDPQANVILNFAKDYAFGINEGRFRLELDKDTKKPVVLYNYNDGNGMKEYKLTQKDLQKAVHRTGQGVLGVTDQEKYNEAMKIKYTAAAGGGASGDYQAVNFKGTVDTYKTSSIDPETNKRVTITKRVRKIEAEKAKLYQFCVNDVYTNTVTQNMWQMTGGPGMTINENTGEITRMKKPDRSDFANNATGETEYKDYVKKYNSTFVYKGTPDQKEIAAEMQYKDMLKKLEADNPGSTISDTERIEANKELVKEYKESGVFNFKTDKLVDYIEGGRGVIRKTNGEYDLGLQTLWNNYDNLSKNNHEGAIAFLNEYYKGYGGKVEFANAAQIKQMDPSARVKDDMIYEKSGGKWYARPNLNTKRGLFSKLQRSPGISTNVNKSAYYKTLDELEADENDTSQLRQEEATGQLNAQELAIELT